MSDTAAVDLVRWCLAEAAGGTLQVSELLKRARREGIPRHAVEDAIWKLVRDGEAEFTPDWTLRQRGRRNEPGTDLAP
jgi:hypothetical protein